MPAAIYTARPQEVGQARLPVLGRCSKFPLAAPPTPTPISTPTPSPASTVLTASPPQLNFGNVVAPGTSKPKKVTLTNKGKAAAEIWNRTVTAPFTIGPGLNTCF